MKQNVLLEKNDKEIITILELPELYTDALVQSAEQELNRRNIPQEVLQTMAEELFRQRCRELFEDRRFPVVDFDLPTSKFLEETEREKMILEEFERVIDRRRLFNKDLPRMG